MVVPSGNLAVAFFAAGFGAAVAVALFAVSAAGATMRRSRSAMAAATAAGLAGEELLRGVAKAIFLGALAGFVAAFAIVISLVALRRRAAPSEGVPPLTEAKVA